MSATQHNVADIIWQSPRSDIQVLSISVRQAISEPYIIEAEVKSEASDIVFSDMLQAQARIVLKCGDELSDDRFFAGIITSFSQGRTRHGNLANAGKPTYCYHVEIRPKLWLLTRRYRSRVFQKATARDYISEILGEHGVKAAWDIQGSLQPREYCLQYQESDFNFMSRLLEDEGICYYFDQDADKVIFTNHAGGHTDCKPKAEAKYVEEISPRFAFGKQEFINDFNYRETISTGTMVHNHYNYTTSQTNIMAEDSEGKVPCYTDLEAYEHSRNFVDKTGGERFAELRKQESFAGGKLGRGTTSARSFEAGNAFTMSDHFRGDLNTSWLLTTCAINAEQGRYRCDFTALQAGVPFRPARKTPKPRVTGLQTAVVTGPSGSKVYLDDMGRCKLQFHWDREGGKNDRSSMWVRVSNGYAGKDYGIQWIPRVGHEVLVIFINGDPDLPLVMGRAYNDFNTAPLGPVKKWQNIIKTIKDNHIMFDDEDNKEKVDIRAQKDMSTLVLNDKSTNVGHDESVTIGNDATETVKKNKTVTVEEQDYKETTGRNKTVVVGDKRETTIERGEEVLTVKTGNRTVEVKTGKDIHNVKANREVTVHSGNDQLTVKSGKRSLTIEKTDDLTAKKGRKVEVTSGNYQVKASNEIILTGVKKINAEGKNEVIVSGKKISITGTTEITLTVGSSTVKIDASGVTIAGPKVMSSATAMNQVTGAIVKIN